MSSLTFLDVAGYIMLLEVIVTDGDDVGILDIPNVWNCCRLDAERTSLPLDTVGKLWANCCERSSKFDGIGCVECVLIGRLLLSEWNEHNFVRDDHISPLCQCNCEDDRTIVSSLWPNPLIDGAKENDADDDGFLDALFPACDSLLSNAKFEFEDGSWFCVGFPVFIDRADDSTDADDIPEVPAFS